MRGWLLTSSDSGLSFVAVSCPVPTKAGVCSLSMMSRVSKILFWFDFYAISGSDLADWALGCHSVPSGSSLRGTMMFVTTSPSVLRVGIDLRWLCWAAAIYTLAFCRGLSFAAVNCSP